MSELDATAEGLRYSSGLRQLDLVSNHSSDVPGEVRRILSHLPSHNLTTLNLIDYYGADPVIPARWLALDQALSEERFAHLTSFKVTSASQILVAALSGCMPSSDARGILRGELMEQ